MSINQKSKIYDSIIFDLDGTLWDNIAASVLAFNKAYRLVGINKEVTTEFVRSITGKTYDECIEILSKDLPEDIKDLLKTELDTLELNAIRQDAQKSLYPGVTEGLEKLSKFYKLYLVSNCSTPYLKVFQEAIPHAELFLDFECFGNTQLPKSTNIELVVSRNKLTNPCYIGDTASDEEAALKAGVDFFHAKYGFGQPKGVYLAFENFSELTQYFIARVQ